MCVGGALLFWGELFFGSGGWARHNQIFLGAGVAGAEKYFTAVCQQHMSIGAGWFAAGALAVLLASMRVTSDAHAVAAVGMHGLVMLSHHQHGEVASTAHATHLALAAAAVAFRLAGRKFEV